MGEFHKVCLLGLTRLLCIQLGRSSPPSLDTIEARLKARGSPSNEMPAQHNPASLGRGAPAGGPAPAMAPLPPALPSTAETVEELHRRLGKELYRVEMDLQGGARIAGKPCDCLSRSKHLGGLEATAEELMSYGKNPTLGKVVDWANRHAMEFEPTEIAKREPAYYQGLAPEVRALRKEVMGTAGLGALLNDEERAQVASKIKQEMGVPGG